MSTTLDAEVVDNLGVEGGYSEKNICFGHDIAIFHKKRDEEYI